MSKKNNRRHKNYKAFSKYKSYTIADLLCKDCKKLGYCRIARRNRFDDKPIALRWERPLTRPVNFDLKYYSAKIPFRVSEGTRLNEFGRKHLQTAYEAFHQDDFETALLNYKCIDHGGVYNNQPDYFLALTYFMLEQYENAAVHMQAFIDNTYFATEDFTPFIEECERRYSSHHNLETKADQTGCRTSVPVFTKEFDPHQL